MAGFRKTKTPGVFIRHQARCPASGSEGRRCRCAPSYRGKRRNPVTGKAEWSRSSKERAEAVAWMAALEVGGEALRERAAEGRSLQSLYDEWMAGAESGRIPSGRKGRAYSETTIAAYKRSWIAEVGPEFGHRPATSIEEHEWQAWADALARRGLSRSTVANRLAVASAIYRWASRSTRQQATGVRRNPIRLVELPGVPEKQRTRVVPREEAAQLLAALDEDRRVPYALAFYAGLRRAEIHRLDWEDVDLDGYRIVVRKAKSDAGTNRRPPIAQPLRPILLRAHLRAGKPARGRVCAVSVMSGKLADHARADWAAAAAEPPLDPVTLHECRHTWASFLMAAGYTLKELMEYGGWEDLQMVNRYVKLLGQPDETDPAERLNAYLAREARA